MDIFLTVLAQIPDPRRSNARHDLGELLVIAFVAVLCGAKSCVEMAECGLAKERFFREFLKLRHGIPSHDTFSAVFRMLDPKALDAAFGRIVNEIADRLEGGGPIAIDGKALRGARDKGAGAKTRMMVSAYDTGLRLTLASVPADGGQELAAAIEALRLIALKGRVVTGDALHCNRSTVAAINEKGGDWCLSLKANQDSLLSDARSCFGKLREGHAEARTEEQGHGRSETRIATVVSAKGLAEHHDFEGLKAFGRIESTRQTGKKTTTETRYFALSWQPSPEVLLTTVRAHWQIENALHWQLDVSFREDYARNRKDNGPHNIAVLRRRALDVARQDPSRGSLSVKLQRAGWQNDFLLNLLRQLAQA